MNKFFKFLELILNIDIMPQVPGLIKYSAVGNVNTPSGVDEIIFQDSISKAFFAKNAAGVLVPLNSSIAGAPTGVTNPPQGTIVIWQCTTPTVGYVTNAYYSRNYLGVDTYITSGSGVVPVAPGTPTGVSGTGAGTSPTITILGNDLVGQLNIVTGSAPSAGPAAVIATITLGAIVFPNYAMPVLQASNPLSSVLYNTQQIQVYPIGPKSWALATTSVALVAASGYQWTYQVSGY